MKPRTKLHLRCTELSAKLPKLTEEQKDWAFFNCLKHWAYRNKTNTFCLDCGHVWATKDNSLLIVKLCETSYICPNCGKKLDVIDTRNKKAEQYALLGFFDTTEGFQVNRFYEIKAYHKSGTTSRLFIREIVQQWLQPDGKNEVIARNRRNMGYGDNFHGDLEIRDRRRLNDDFNLYPTRILPGSKYLPVYKRNGFKGNFREVLPYYLFTGILTDSKAETLLKSNQFGLLAARLGSRSWDVEQYWNSVKICIRNKYIVKDGITWLDYLKLLQFFCKDLNNAKYVCPTNLKSEHDLLAAKKTEIDRKERYTDLLIGIGETLESFKNLSSDAMKIKYDRLIFERNLEKAKKKAQKDEAGYVQAKGVYFGIAFTDGPITIKILESLEEFIAEAEAHKHCVFSNEYYKREDSLIFSAQVNGQLVETIEVSISKMQVVQSRGLQNKASEYNKQIVDLMNKNMRMIKKRHKEQKTIAA